MDNSHLRRALAVAFCVFLAWRTMASLVSLAGEIRSYDVRSLMDAVSLTEEERIQRTLQDDYAILTTLRGSVPKDGVVLFVTGSTLSTVQRALRVGVLLYPPRFDLVARLLPLVPGDAGGADVPVFAVDLVGEESPPPSTWELVEQPESFRLWRYRTPKRSRE